MASTKRKTIHLFNCDNLCDLSEVESLLTAVEKNTGFKIIFFRHQFSGSQIAAVVEKTIPNLRGLDYAVFVVHAHECSLAFTEESPYGKIYKALKKRAGLDENVLLVIGGDDNYKDDDEQERDFLSRWARETAISRQFYAEFMDGRKSFIFSWNKKHRAIHEEALLHYFDPSKKGEKFKYEPKPKPVPETEEADIDPPAAIDIQQEEPTESLQESDNEETVGGIVDKHYGELSLSVSDSTDFSSPGSNYTLMLNSYLRNGEISFASKDVLTWDGSWRPPTSVTQRLKQKWGSTRLMRLKIFVDQNGEVKKVIVKQTNWSYCPVS